MLLMLPLIQVVLLVQLPQGLVGQEALLAPGMALRALADAGRLPSLILWGPPGTGKTTLA